MQRRENGAFASQHDLQKLNDGTCMIQKIEATNVYFNSGDNGTDDDGATEGGSIGSGSIAALGGGYYLSAVKPPQQQKKQNVPAINIVKCNDQNHHHGSMNVGGDMGGGILSSSLSPLRDEDIDIFSNGYNNGEEESWKGGEVGSSSSALKKGGIYDSVDSFRAVFEQQLQVNVQPRQIPSSSSAATATIQLPVDPLSLKNCSNKEGNSSDSHDGYMDSPVTWDSPMTTTDGAVSSCVSSHHNTSPLPPTAIHYPNNTVGLNTGLRQIPTSISSSQHPPHSVVPTQITTSSGGVGTLSIGGPTAVDYNQLQSQPQLPLPPHQQQFICSSSGGTSATLQPSQQQQQLHIPPPQLQLPPQQQPQLQPPQPMCHFNNGFAGLP